MQKLCENLYNKLEDVRQSHEQVMEQRFSVPENDEDDDMDKDPRINRRLNLAMN